MTKEDKEKINHQLVMIRNVATLMKIMFKPVQQHMQELNYTQEKAIERIEKAHNFLKNYGVDYLETAEKYIREITDKEFSSFENIAKNL